MRLTKYSHSCVRIEDDGRVLVIDPGVWSEAEVALDGAEAVLISHEHIDHVDVDVIRKAAATNTNLKIWAPISVSHDFHELGDRVTTVGPDESFEAAGFRVRTFGGQHALIHPLIPLVINVGYLVNEAVYHPGDSFVPPPVPVSTLLVPIHAPWSKLAEVIDFVIGVRPKRAIQIHDGLLNQEGIKLSEMHLGRLSGNYGTEFMHLNSGDQIDV